jgi:hypothetical protein
MTPSPDSDRRLVNASNAVTIPTILKTYFSDPSRGSVVIVSTGASVATGPVKLVKLANAPSGTFPPQPKVDEKLPCG